MAKAKQAARLYLMRHGSTGPALYGRMVGSSDVPLGPEGPEQVRRAAARLAGIGFSAFYTSPKLRARQSAAIVGEELGLGGAEVVDDLREVDFGRWERLTFAEISGRDPELAARWRIWSPDFAFPGGERIGDFVARVGRAAATLPRAGENVLVVAHGGVVRALLCHFLGLEPSQYLLFDVKPAGIAVVDVFEGGRGVMVVE